MVADTNFAWDWILTIVSVAVIVLMFLATIFFIILVTYLKQWDIYYPPIDKWLKAREKAKKEAVRKQNKAIGRIERRGKLGN